MILDDEATEVREAEEFMIALVTNPETLETEDWVLVKFATKKSHTFYVGQVIHKKNIWKSNLQDGYVFQCSFTGQMFQTYQECLLMKFTYIYLPHLLPK